MGRVRKNHSKAAIANYWMEWEDEHGQPPPWVTLHNGYGFVDWGEPSCMGCGIWKEEWDKPYPGKSQKPRGKYWEIARQWNRSTLEKCHVVAIYRGGVDEVENMVLMCSWCHDAQPDTTDPDDTYRYMRRRDILDTVSLVLQRMPEEAIEELSKVKPDWKNPAIAKYFPNMTDRLERYHAEATE